MRGHAIKGCSLNYSAILTIKGFSIQMVMEKKCYRGA